MVPLSWHLFSHCFNYLHLMTFCIHFCLLIFLHIVQTFCIQFSLLILLGRLLMLLMPYLNFRRLSVPSLLKLIYNTYFFIVFIIFKNPLTLKNLKKNKGEWTIYLIIYFGNIKYIFIIKKLKN